MPARRAFWSRCRAIPPSRKNSIRAPPRPRDGPSIKDEAGRRRHRDAPRPRAWMFVPLRRPPRRSASSGCSSADASPRRRPGGAAARSRPSKTRWPWPSSAPAWQPTCEDLRVEAEGEKLRTALPQLAEPRLADPARVGDRRIVRPRRRCAPTADRKALAETGLDEARRLDRYVQNLLNMTRLEYGASNT